MRNHHRGGPKYLQNTHSLHSLPSSVKITICTEYIVKMYAHTRAYMYMHMYRVHRNTCRVYFVHFNHSKYMSKLCRWKSQRNYCFGDYFVSLMQHVDRIKLYLLRTGVGIYRVTGMLIKTDRGITRGPIPLITRESGAAAVWCKCTWSNASALAMLSRRADTLRVNPICPQSSRYDHTDAKRF